MTNELLTCKQVLEIVPLTTSTLYRLMRQNRFPTPLKIGRRNVRWKRSEVLAWLDNCPRAEGEPA